LLGVQKINVGGKERIAGNTKINGAILEVDISANMKQLVFETPEMPNHIIWKYVWGGARSGRWK